MSAPRGGGDPVIALEREPLRPYYLLHGAETFLVERGVDVLRRRLVPESRVGAWRTLWAGEDAARLSAVLADLRSPLLFGGVEVVVLRQAHALDEAGQEQLLAALPPLEAGGGHLVLIAGATDLRRRLFAACVRVGAAFEFAPPADLRAVRDWVVRLARERGHEITAAAVDRLLERAGRDLAQLAGEVEKLSLHVGRDGRIGPAHVDAVVGRLREHEVQELTDRIAAGDLAGALGALRHLLDQGEPPIRAVAFLAANLRRALHVAELADAGVPAAEIARRLRLPPWLVSKSLGRGRAPDLARALERLAQVDLQLKNSRPARAVFEAALLKMAEPSRASRP